MKIHNPEKVHTYRITYESPMNPKDLANNSPPKRYSTCSFSAWCLDLSLSKASSSFWQSSRDTATRRSLSLSLRICLSNFPRTASILPSACSSPTTTYWRQFTLRILMVIVSYSIRLDWIKLAQQSRNECSLFLKGDEEHMKTSEMRERGLYPSDGCLREDFQGK